MKRVCPACRFPGYDKGRALDGRRAYRCQSCAATWTEGLQGAKKRYSKQRDGFQFFDTGAARWSEPFDFDAWIKGATL